MKPILLGIILGIVAGLCSCGNVPIVKNRAADGTFLPPDQIACPQCGQHFSDQASLYRDANGHYAVSVYSKSGQAPALQTTRF